MNSSIFLYLKPMKCVVVIPVYSPGIANLISPLSECLLELYGRENDNE